MIVIIVIVIEYVFCYMKFVTSTQKFATWQHLQFAYEFI